MLLQSVFITFHDKVECFLDYLPFSALNLVECSTYYVMLNKHLIFGSFPLLILINALTLNLLTTTIVARSSNASKFKSAFKELTLL